MRFRLVCSFPFHWQSWVASTAWSNQVLMTNLILYFCTHFPMPFNLRLSLLQDQRKPRQRKKKNIVVTLGKPFLRFFFSQDANLCTEKVIYPHSFSLLRVTSTYYRENKQTNKHKNDSNVIHFCTKKKKKKEQISNCC